MYSVYYQILIVWSYYINQNCIFDLHKSNGFTLLISNINSYTNSFSRNYKGCKIYYVQNAYNKIACWNINNRVNGISFALMQFFKE